MVNRSTSRFIAYVIETILLLISLKKGKWIWVVFVILAGGMLLPQEMVIPVKDATTTSWADDSFWHYPWGKSVTHKGIDIFAPLGTDVLASTYGIVVHNGYNGMGGNSIIVLGPKWRFHYYAHLETKTAGLFSVTKPGESIGTVGDTGNAKGKPPHLHYSISTPIPYAHLADSSVQGWKKMFYLDPDQWLRE